MYCKNKDVIKMYRLYLLIYVKTTAQKFYKLIKS